ncbi:MAG: hypothetical protein ACREUW_10685 [Burkholderiales bacterium]
MTFDSTMKFSTTMTRPEIEAKLPELAKFATAADLPEVAQLLTGAAGQPAAEMERRFTQCLVLLDAKDEYGLLIDQIDMLMLNLPNIKGA